jgi:hypothetical protein
MAFDYDRRDRYQQAGHIAEMMSGRRSRGTRPSGAFASHPSTPRSSSSCSPTSVNFRPLLRRLGRPGSRDPHLGPRSSVGPRCGRLPRARPRMRNQPHPVRGRTDSSSNRYFQLPRVLGQQRLTRFLWDEVGASHGTQGAGRLRRSHAGSQPYLPKSDQLWFPFHRRVGDGSGTGPAIWPTGCVRSYT